ncbi:putative FAD-binding dehydrogenase [compost metagenome]
MASVMDGHYPSGGITLGPGMTFGYLAGLELAGLAAQGDGMKPISRSVGANSFALAGYFGE